MGMGPECRSVLLLPEAWLFCPSVCMIGGAKHMIDTVSPVITGQEGGLDGFARTPLLPSRLSSHVKRSDIGACKTASLLPKAMHHRLSAIR